MAIEWLAVGPNGEITDQTCKMVILNVLVRSEARLGTLEVDPPGCSMVECCKRILVAADPTVLVPGGAFYRSAEGSPR